MSQIEIYRRKFQLLNEKNKKISILVIFCVSDYVCPKLYFYLHCLNFYKYYLSTHL